MVSSRVQVSRGVPGLPSCGSCVFVASVYFTALPTNLTISKPDLAVRAATNSFGAATWAAVDSHSGLVRVLWKLISAWHNGFAPRLPSEVFPRGQDVVALNIWYLQKMVRGRVPFATMWRVPGHRVPFLVPVHVCVSFFAFYISHFCRIVYCVIFRISTRPSM